MNIIVRTKQQRVSAHIEETVHLNVKETEEITILLAEASKNEDPDNISQQLDSILGDFTHNVQLLTKGLPYFEPEKEMPLPDTEERDEFTSQIFKSSLAISERENLKFGRELKEGKDYSSLMKMNLVRIAIS